MKGLLVLDVAARHLNFKGAAEELSVTPEAVRKGIRTLEMRLGIRLIRPTQDGFELTEEAVNGLPALRDGVQKFEQSVQAIAPSHSTMAN